MIFFINFALYFLLQINQNNYENNYFEDDELVALIDEFRIVKNKYEPDPISKINKNSDFSNISEIKSFHSYDSTKSDTKYIITYLKPCFEYFKFFKGIFYNCSSLISLPDISNWNTNNVIDMSYIFYNCSSLISLPDISKWNTNNVIDMSYIFYNCSSLESLPDISKWNTDKVKYMSYLFKNCYSLKFLPD